MPPTVCIAGSATSREISARPGPAWQAFLPKTFGHRNQRKPPLKLIDNIGGQQVRVAQTDLRDAAARQGAGRPEYIALSIRLMIPAEFQSAQNVFPQVILHRGSDPQDLGR